VTRPSFDIVVIASSLGGPDALATVLGLLPRDFPVPIAVVQHLGREGSMLVDLLGPRISLPAAWGIDCQVLAPGCIHLAPPDRHMLVQPGGRLRLVRMSPVKFCRPAADPLFVSAAAAYRERTLGVVLTGCNTDGAAGVQAIKWNGGMVLVQDPATARAAGMPQAAAATGCADLVLPLEALARAIVGTVMAPCLGDFLRVPLRAA
jgi:two-component system, chemotaxis family, protein-glutamate methylesterase/glutaminase